MSPIPEDYVDVAQRIREFKEQYPEGSLQAHESPRLWKVGEQEYIGYCAAAYRTPDDERPGIGWAWEPVPGPTPFTRDSELMNAETSAWGRAIVALGFETKKIASANEVRNRQGNGELSEREASSRERAGTPGSSSSRETAPGPLGTRSESASERKASAGTVQLLKETVAALEQGHPLPDPTRTWWHDVQAFLRSTFDKERTGDLSEAEMQQVIQEFEGRLAEQRQVEEIPFG